jgi:hypothetical protein
MNYNQNCNNVPLSNVGDSLKEIDADIVEIICLDETFDTDSCCDTENLEEMDKDMKQLMVELVQIVEVICSKLGSDDSDSEAQMKHIKIVPKTLFKKVCVSEVIYYYYIV